MTRRDPIDRDAWTDAALRVMTDAGLKGVVVETLARELHVTKGSFYWHFTSRDALLSAAVDRWEQRETDVLARATAAIPDPRQRLVELIERAHYERGLRLTRAFTAAADHPLVGLGVRRVAKRRLSFLTECFSALGAEPTEAKNAARMIYAAYLGFAELNALGFGVQTKAEMRAYVDRMIAALVPDTR